MAKMLLRITMDISPMSFQDKILSLVASQRKTREQIVQKLAILYEFTNNEIEEALKTLEADGMIEIYTGHRPVEIGITNKGRERVFVTSFLPAIHHEVSQWPIEDPERAKWLNAIQSEMRTSPNIATI